MTSGKRIGIRFNLFMVFCLLSGVMVIAWGEEHEGRGRKSLRTPYKEIPSAAKQTVSYAKDVKPILVENCTRCHGSKKHKADLRLDTPDGIRTGGEDGPIIKSGKGAQSLLVRSVAGIDVESDQVMPPSGELLTKEEIGILRAWIDQGATFDDK